MKIGILTLPLHTNYGGILQAYALQTVLERMGHEVVVFDKPYLITRSSLKNIIVFFKHLIKKTLGIKSSFINSKKHNKRENAKRRYTNVFIQKYIKRRLINNYYQIKPSDYDAIVVGSDQIWRRRFMPYQDVRIAFLDFTKGLDIKRIAYAASFGIDYWDFTENDTNIIKESISLFDAVSVREDSGVSLCKQYLGYNNAIQVLDPTLLLERKDYESLIGNNDNTYKPKGQLMLYILNYNDEKKQFISQVSNRLNLNPFETNSKYEVKGASFDEIVQPPVEQWLRSFRDSSYVITDSFHACVFSILFHKPFIVIGNKSRGLARFQSLLSLFELEDRMLIDTYDISLCNKEINWEKVDPKLDKLRADSKSFLEKSLKS